MIRFEAAGLESFRRTGRAITRMDYWPVLQDGKFADVVYADATSQLLHR